MIRSAFSFAFFVAWKYITHRKRQAILSLVAVAVAVGIAVLSSAMQNGFFEFLMGIVFKNLPHVTILPADGEDYIHLYRLTVEGILAMNGVAAVSPTLTVSATLAYKDNVENVGLVGMNPRDIDEMSGLGESMISGDINSVMGGRRVLLGQSLADSLEAKMGDSLEASFPDARTTNLVVSGIFDTGYEEVDSSTAYVSLETAQEFQREGDVVNAIEIKLEDIYQAPALAQYLSSRGYEAKDWEEMFPQLIKTLAFERTSNFITLMLIMIIAAFGIASIMNMLVLEKTRDIGMLMALGADSFRIMRVFLIESAILGLTGGILGCLLAFLVGINLRQLQVPSPTGEMINMPVLLTLQDMITYTLIAVLLSIMAAAYPAYKASRLDPVEALKG